MIFQLIDYDGSGEIDADEFMEFINDDEYLEVTPKSLRIRKIPN